MQKARYCENANGISVYRRILCLAPHFLTLNTFVLRLEHATNTERNVIPSRAALGFMLVFMRMEILRYLYRPAAVYLNLSLATSLGVGTEGTI